MNVKYFYLSIFMGLFTCAPVYKTVIMEEYNNETKLSGKLAIAPIKNLTIFYFGNVNDEFGEGNKYKLIKEHFLSNLTKQLEMKSTFSTIFFGTYKKRPNWKNTKFDMDDAYGLHLFLPSDTQTIQFNELKADYILFIQDAYIGTDSRHSSNMDTQSKIYSSISNRDNQLSYLGNNFSGFTPPSPTSSNNFKYMQFQQSKKYLVYKCGFAIWDNQKHRVIVYGKIDANIKAGQYGLGTVQIIRMQHWNSVDKQFGNSILIGTPFEK